MNSKIFHQIEEIGLEVKNYDEEFQCVSFAKEFSLQAAYMSNSNRGFVIFYQGNKVAGHTLRFPAMCSTSNIDGMACSLKQQLTRRTFKSYELDLVLKCLRRMIE